LRCFKRNFTLFKFAFGSYLSFYLLHFAVVFREFYRYFVAVIHDILNDDVFVFV